MYHRLIASWDSASAGEQRRRSEGARRLRLMMSGSAALPVHMLERWREITGHTLLERYGMTEIGMALSNPLHGERRPGFVGNPLPGVEVRVVDEAARPVSDGTPGELEVRGPSVFREYWRRPDETERTFREGWFRTGDVAVDESGPTGCWAHQRGHHQNGRLQGLGTRDRRGAARPSRDCRMRVVGIADPEWGERVALAVELKPGASVSLEDLQTWAKPQLAPYKVPRALRSVETLPRNAMGKVLKPTVRLCSGEWRPVKATWPSEFFMLSAAVSRYAPLNAPCRRPAARRRARGCCLCRDICPARRRILLP
jgi:malonyl-CoA/methylmalonyl-CoA synthetase